MGGCCYFLGLGGDEDSACLLAFVSLMNAIWERWRDASEGARGSQPICLAVMAGRNITVIDWHSWGWMDRELGLFSRGVHR